MRCWSHGILALSLLCAACGTSTGGNGVVPDEDAVCPDDVCMDTLTGDATDTQDVAGATDAALNDIAGADAPADAAKPDTADALVATDAADAVDVQGVDAAEVDSGPAVDDVVADATDVNAGPDVAADAAADLEVVGTEDAGADADAEADVLVLADMGEDAESDGVMPVDAAEDAQSDVVNPVDAADAQADADAGGAVSDPWASCPATQVTTLYEATDWVQELRVYGGNVYWTAYAPNFTAESWVHAMPITGVPLLGTPATLAIGSKTDTTLFQGLDVDANGVYFASNGKGGILSAPLSADGSQPATVLVGQEGNAVMLANQPRRLTVFGGTIYFREDEYSPFTFAPGIRQVSTLGGAVSAVANVPKTAGYPHVNSAGLAFNAAADAANSIVGGIYFLAAGSNTPQLLSGGSQVIGPDIDASTVYWSQLGGGTDGIWKAPMATGVATQVAKMDGVNVLVQDDASGNIYFYASKIDGPFLNAAIFKVAKSGGTPVALVCNLPGAVWGIRSDANNVYFSFANGKAASWSLAPDAIGSVAK